MGTRLVGERMGLYCSKVVVRFELVEISKVRVLDSTTNGRRAKRSPLAGANSQSMANGQEKTRESEKDHWSMKDTGDCEWFCKFMYHLALS